MTGTHIHYYYLCKRKLWLFAKTIDMEHNSDLVRSGKFISENTYTRAEHELRIGDITLDFFDRKTRTIHEIKRSDSLDEVHSWQVKYYIFYLEANGVDGVTGVIDYPKLRKKIKVQLYPDDREELQRTIADIEKILAQPAPPPVIDKPFCPKCAYFDLCYS